MKKLLILIVAIAVYLHFYPQAEVTEFYEKQKAIVLNTVSKFSDTKIRLKADKVFTDLQPSLSSFSADEIDYLKDITSSRTNIKSFYNNFCQGQVTNFVFHKDNQSKVCAVISEYKNLF